MRPTPPAIIMTNPPTTDSDRVYRTARPLIADFAFDSSVAAVFPDMIRRSVPGYELVVPMTGLLAARAAAEASVPLIYDLGCSLGATTLATLQAADAVGAPPELAIQAVDNSPAMLERAAETIRDPRVSFVEADIRTLALAPCAVVMMNYVLQFITPEDRPGLLRRIRKSLGGQGLLVLSEKIRFDDPAEQAFNESAHLDFKRANGYSELEISQKRTALERVMIIDSLSTHLARLEEAGFGSIRVWYRCLNWVSIAAGP